MAPNTEEEGSSMEVDTPEESKETTGAKKKNENITPSASGAEASKYPDMQLAQSIHRLTMVTGPDAALDAEGSKAAGIPSDLSETVMKQVGGEEVENPSLYRHLRSTLGWEGQAGCLSDADLTAMEARHKTKMEDLEKKVEEAKENAGDMEVLDARFDVARFAAKSLSKDEALEAYDKVFALPKLSSGKKIDCLMESARVALFHGDNKKTAEIVDKAAKLAEAGGDWDRRNRLKVYSSLSKLLVRDVKGAASLLIDCIATFSCTELCSYTDFVGYTIVSNILYIPRTELKSKIIDGPEILSVASDIPVVVSSVLVCACIAIYQCDVCGECLSSRSATNLRRTSKRLLPHRHVL
jgi:26S proteasome regulatory subunit N7